jgi:hypothetical protein
MQTRPAMRLRLGRAQHGPHRLGRGLKVIVDDHVVEFGPVASGRADEMIAHAIDLVRPRLARGNVDRPLQIRLASQQRFGDRSLAGNRRDT